MSSKVLNLIKPNEESDDEFVSIDKELEVDDNDNDGSDEELNHSQLLTKISSLNSKQKKALRWKASRFESNPDVNEFNLSKSNEKLSINDLLKNVKASNSGGLKQLKHWNKKLLLDKPLNKPLADKIKRKVGYHEVNEDLKKWDSLVEANRNADHLQFPLNQQVLGLETAKEVVKNFEPKTKLEIEVSELLKKSENALTDDKALTVAEEKILKAMSIEEARIRHKELQKMRALLSYQEVRLKRQSKIKSKRYHRILKREKLKKSLEEFEDKKTSDPNAAIDKLNELDKLRALERASLKHKNTGKWAKHLKLRTKYDDSARTALTEQLQINQKLMKKRVHFESDEEVNKKESESDEEEEDQNETNGHKDNDFQSLPSDYNPWMRSGRLNRKKPEEEVPSPHEEANDQPINFETSGAVEEDSEQLDLPSNRIPENKEPEIEEVSNQPSGDVQIDPNDFITIKSHKLKSSLPDVVTELDSDAESDDESDGVSDDEQRKLVSEAFAEDDVIRDFKKDKMEQIENEDNKAVNLHLPGWGSWGGTGIKSSKRKVKQYSIKAKKRQRKDRTLGNVIISEKKDDIIAKYRVNQLPFPFKNVVEFENSIRQPIGRTWNPETAFRHLTQPKVVTKMGTIIEPIDSEALVNNKLEKHHQIKRRVKKQKQIKKINK